MSKILIVEDNNVMRYTMKSMVEDLGHEVIAEAGDANSALKYARESKPDVVLLDLVLPGGITGVEIIQKLKQISPTKIIVITGIEEKEIDKDIFKKGCDTILKKPFSLDELENTLNKILKPGN